LLLSEGAKASFKRLRLDAVEDEEEMVGVNPEEEEEEEEEEVVEDAAVYADTADARGCEPNSLTCKEC